MHFEILLLFSAIPLLTAQAAGGYEAYANGGGGTATKDANILSAAPSNSNAMAPSPPMAPPRVPLSESVVGPSLGYRPPPPPVRRDAEMGTKCSFDKSKWSVEPQSAIAGAIMFDRTTGINCEECLNKCTQFQDASNQWICRSVTYDSRWKICDLFAVDGTSHPYFLTEYEGRDYFAYQAALPPTDAQVNGEKQGDDAANNAVTDKEAKPETGGGEKTEVAVSASFDADKPVPTEAATSPQPEQLATEANAASAVTDAIAASSSAAEETPAAIELTTASESPIAATPVAESKPEYQAVKRPESGTSASHACQSDEIAHFADFSLYERKNIPQSDIQVVPAKTREECVAACESEENITCLSATFTPAGCELSVSSANHSDSNALTSSASSSYLEKVCLPAKIAKGAKRIFSGVPGHILVGHVQEVADASTIRECITACMRAEQEYGFVCKSVMWYPSDDNQNCLLNTESRYTQPDVFINEDQGVVMAYFDVPRDDTPLKDNSLAMRFRDAPLDSQRNTKWTRWSMCNGGDESAMRHRYLKCTTKKDIRKCPKESVMCRHAPTLQIQKLSKPQSHSKSSVEKAINECLAVRDSHGRKRCPHGIRLDNEGRREYCRMPVDC